MLGKIKHEPRGFQQQHPQGVQSWRCNNGSTRRPGGKTWSYLTSTRTPPPYPENEHVPPPELGTKNEIVFFPSIPRE